LERAGDDWSCLTVRSVLDLVNCAYADVVEHATAAARLTDQPGENLGVAALALAYAGDHDRARTLNEQSLATVTSPSLRAWGTYVAGEIDTCAGRSRSAEGHYQRAIELARTAGATFLVGVATVGLQAVRARAGRTHEALRGYDEVIGYFARTGNWTHQWTTLRNLADLLRRLGDDGPADLIDAAADQAPDAPAVDPAGRPDRRRAVRPTTVPDRNSIVDVARQAIARHLTSA
jgi:tetratricopeptide (TPR) repeat protein